MGGRTIRLRGTFVIDCHYDGGGEWNEEECKQDFKSVVNDIEYKADKIDFLSLDIDRDKIEVEED